MSFTFLPYIQNLNKGIVTTFDRVLAHTRLANPRKEMSLSLVVPCYNVAPYIEQFLASIFDQTVLPERLEIILVNDGSTDNTGDIIDAWRARYPDYLRVLHQPNGGLSAARNAGLEIATGTWVGFPDPDDFLDPDYFRHMLAEVKRTRLKPLLAVMSNLILYFEDREEFSDSHALRYRFVKPVTRLKSGNLGKFINLNVNYAWLRRDVLLQHSLVFDGKVKPSFEDAHLFNRLLLSSPKHTISFVAAAKYFYRKRSDKSSLVDREKLHPDWYAGQIRYGYLALLKQGAAQFGKPPVYIQRTVLYGVFWKFRYLVNQPHRASFLTPDQSAAFLALLDEVFDYIDAKTIADFKLAGCTEPHKVALLALYKNTRRERTKFYQIQTDERAGLVQFHYYTGGEDEFTPQILVNGKKVSSELHSRTQAEFLGGVYYRAHYFWVPMAPGDRIKISAHGKQGRIDNPSAEKKRAKTAAKNALRPATSEMTEEEVKRLRAYVKSKSHVYRGCKILMDKPN